MKTFSAIKIVHPLGEFYLAALPVELLLKVAFTTPLTLNEGNIFDGNQRRRDVNRVKDIAKYLQTQDAVLPGTIILAANCTTDGEILSPTGDQRQQRWTIDYEIKSNDSNIVTIQIPTEEKLAAVVDGQHRLWGFECLSEDLKKICLPCSIFFDLPTPQQAAVFATINFNQKPVSKSQSYDLFGYNLDDEKESAWSPDKLAVFFTRKLNVDEDSPFCNHIKVIAQDDRVLADIIKQHQKEWAVSTATIVEGILSLITKNPKDDRNALHRYPLEERSRKNILHKGSNPPPLRDLFLDENRDIVIYKALLNYFNAINALFWADFSDSSKSLIRKTAGIQALFRVLKELLPRQVNASDFRQATWEIILKPAQCLDFENAMFTESSGKGKTRIQDAIFVAIRIKNISDIKDDELKKYLETVTPAGGNNA